MYACMHVRMYARMHVRRYTCTHVCMYACMYVCMYGMYALWCTCACPAYQSLSTKWAECLVSTRTTACMCVCTCTYVCVMSAWTFFHSELGIHVQYMYISTVRCVHVCVHEHAYVTLEGVVGLIGLVDFTQSTSHQPELLDILGGAGPPLPSATPGGALLDLLDMSVPTTAGPTPGTEGGVDLTSGLMGLLSGPAEATPQPPSATGKHHPQTSLVLVSSWKYIKVLAVHSVHVTQNVACPSYQTSQA